MSFSKISALAGVVALASQAAAHGLVTGIVADGIYYAGYDMDSQYESDPAESVGWAIPTDLGRGPITPDEYATSDIICHLNATNAQLSAPVSAGGSVELQWTAWPSSHHGPVIDYLADCGGDCATVDKTTLKWFKIDGVGLIDDTTVPGTWADDQLIAANNSWTVNIPSDIASGNYVLRHEIIALHSAGSANGAQNYPQCVNLQISGTGTATPSDDGTLGTALYNSTEAGILINIYEAIASYVVPGPALYTGAAAVASQTPIATGAVATFAVGTGIVGSAGSAATGVVVESSAAAQETSVVATSAPVTSAAVQETSVVATSVQATSASVVTAAAVAQYGNSTVAQHGNSTVSASSKKSKTACKAKTSKSSSASSKTKSACKAKSTSSVANVATAVNNNAATAVNNNAATTITSVIIATTEESAPNETDSVVLTTSAASVTIATTSSAIESDATSTAIESVATATSTASSSSGNTKSSDVTEPTGTTLGDLLSWLSSFYTSHTDSTYDANTVARRHARDVAQRDMDKFGEGHQQATGTATRGFEQATGVQHAQKPSGTGRANMHHSKPSGTGHASKPSGTGYANKPTGAGFAGAAMPTNGRHYAHAGF